MMQTIAQINNVTYRYKGASDNSLDGVSLTIQKGEMLLLCGASGSGKTSVIRLLNGLIPHYYHGDMTGNVTVHRLDINKTQLYELAGVVGTVFQNPRSQFFSVDTDGEIVFGPENIGLDPKEIKARKEIIAKQMKSYCCLTNQHRDLITLIWKELENFCVSLQKQAALYLFLLTILSLLNNAVITNFGLKKADCFHLSSGVVSVKTS